jgi:hypothetical protein
MEAKGDEVENGQVEKETEIMIFYFILFITLLCMLSDVTQRKVKLKMSERRKRKKRGREWIGGKGDRNNDFFILFYFIHSSLMYAK